MRKLRLKYDAIHKFVVEKEEQLEQLKVKGYERSWYLYRKGLRRPVRRRLR